MTETTAAPIGPAEASQQHAASGVMEGVVVRGRSSGGRLRGTRRPVTRPTGAGVERHLRILPGGGRPADQAAPEPDTDVVPAASPVDVEPARSRQHLALVGPGGLLQRARFEEDGMTTAEYAVGTLAACAFGAVLLKVVTSDGIAKLLADLIKRALSVTL